MPLLLSCNPCNPLLSQYTHTRGITQTPAGRVATDEAWALLPCHRELRLCWVQRDTHENTWSFFLSSPQGAGMKDWGMSTCSPATGPGFPPLSPDRPLPCQRTALGQPPPSFINKQWSASPLGQPFDYFENQGSILQPLEGNLAGCVFGPQQIHLQPFLLTAKTKQNLHLSLGQETWE